MNTVKRAPRSTLPPGRGANAQGLDAVNVRYSREDRTGSTYLDLVLIGDKGRVVH